MKAKLKIFFQIRTFLISLFFMIPASAQSKEKITIAMGLTRPPYIDEKTASGLEFEIIDSSFKSVGVKIKPIFASLKRGNLLYNEKYVDGVSTKIVHSLKGYYSEPYINFHNIAVTLKSRNLKITKIEDLNKLSISAFQTAQTVLGPEFKKVTSQNPKYTETQHQESQVAQLLAGRIDVVVMDFLIFKNYREQMKEKGIDSEVTIHQIFPTTHYVMIFHEARNRDAFNKGLSQIRNDKTYSKIMEKYTGCADFSPNCL